MVVARQHLAGLLDCCVPVEPCQRGTRSANKFAPLHPSTRSASKPTRPALLQQRRRNLPHLLQARRGHGHHLPALVAAWWQPGWLPRGLPWWQPQESSAAAVSLLTIPDQTQPSSVPPMLLLQAARSPNAFINHRPFVLHYCPPLALRFSSFFPYVCRRSRLCLTTTWFACKQNMQTVATPLPRIVTSLHFTGASWPSVGYNISGVRAHMLSQ